MAGALRKIYGVPPAPPNRCGLCQLTHHKDIKYFMDTGVWAEHEGVIYLCSRCIESLVKESQEFQSVDEVNEILAEKDAKVSESLSELETLRRQAKKLHDLFGLRLADLDKFTELSAKLDRLIGKVSSYEEKASQRELESQQHDDSVIAAKITLANLNERIETARKELNVFVSESLSRKLHHIGREDLVDVILNNRIPEDLTRALDEYESEAPGDNRTPLSAITNLNF